MATSRHRPPARLLDITRLISRAGTGPLTGVDRVELAYLERLSGEAEPLYLLARSSVGYLLLGPEAAEATLQRLRGKAPWGRADLFSRAVRRGRPALAQAEADLRRLRLARCRPRGLAAMLRLHLPAGAAYLNVGLSNLSEMTLRGVRGAPGMRIAVMIHDTIPLDHPELSGAEAPERFASKLRAVCSYADLLICNSEATRQDVLRHAVTFGRTPETLVAHLGVEITTPDIAALPAGLPPNRAYFITIGTIEPRKNHALLLRVWADLPEAGRPTLVIAGRRGWRNDPVLRQLDPPPAGVIEAPDLQDAALAALLQGARALLFPSLAEGFGLPPLEAAAQGVRVLAAPLPVYRETLGDFGVYLDPADTYSWRKKIIELALDDEGAGEAILPRGPRFVPPSWSNHFNTVLSLI